jgi:hypothetical protein
VGIVAVTGKSRDCLRRDETLVTFSQSDATQRKYLRFIA